MRVGVTGHQRLPDSSAWDWVRSEFARLVASVRRPLLGVSSLAPGADQTFAEAVLAEGAELEVVAPFAGYETRFATAEDRGKYERLLGLAELPCGL